MGTHIGWSVALVGGALVGAVLGMAWIRRLVRPRAQPMSSWIGCVGLANSSAGGGRERSSWKKRLSGLTC